MSNIFKTIFNKLSIKNNNPTNDYDIYLQFEKDISKNIILQKIEDDKIENGIKREARRWIEEDNNGHMGIRLIFPFIHSITIYHSETAKYKNANIRELVIIEYNKLKQELC